jgi:hypothetical protein
MQQGETEEFPPVRGKDEPLLKSEINKLNIVINKDMVRLTIIISRDMKSDIKAPKAYILPQQSTEYVIHSTKPISPAHVQRHTWQAGSIL